MKTINPLLAVRVTGWSHDLDHARPSSPPQDLVHGVHRSDPFRRACDQGPVSELPTEGQLLGDDDGERCAQCVALDRVIEVAA